MDEHDKREWAYVQSLGLKPEIDTLEKYLSASEEGMKRGREFLQKEGWGSGPFTVQELKDLHREIFRDIYPWAGELRTKEITIDKETGIKGSEPDKILPDLESLREAALEQKWFKNPKANLYRHAEEIAGYHIALHQIHPFEDGNGRVMRLILDHQMELFQRSLELNVPENQRPEIAKEREKYLDACTEGVRDGKLSALKNLVLETASLVDKAREREADLAIERGEREWRERERGR